MSAESGPEMTAPPCEICGSLSLRRVSGGKFWCAGCGHLQS